MVHSTETAHTEVSIPMVANPVASTDSIIEIESVATESTPLLSKTVSPVASHKKSLLFATALLALSSVGFIYVGVNDILSEEGNVAAGAVGIGVGIINNLSICIIGKIACKS